MRPRALATAVVAGAALLLATPAPALAHGDGALADDTVELPPGETATFTGELHFHRVAARVVADAPVTVTVTDGDGRTVVREGPAREVRLAELVACCEDAVWTPHQLLVTNPGDAPARADVHARLVHDDVAVMVFGAEAGTRASVAILGLAWAAIVWRVWRRRDRSRPLTHAAWVFAPLAVGVVGAAVVGAVRYGRGGAPGLVAALGDVPILPTNPIVSRASLVVLVTMVGWAVAGARWVQARDVAPRPAWTAGGLAVAGAPVVAGAVVAVGYGTAAVPATMAALAALPLLVVLVAAPRSSPAPRPAAAG